MSFVIIQTNIKQFLTTCYENQSVHRYIQEVDHSQRVIYLTACNYRLHCQTEIECMDAV